MRIEMKRMILIAAAALCALAASAQNGKTIYNRYSEADDVSAVYISPAMFRIMGKIPDMDLGQGDVNISEIIRSMNGLYIISSANSSVNWDLRRDAERFVKSGRYELLMEMKDDGEVCHIYTLGDENVVKGFVLLSFDGPECNFICMDGEMPRDRFEAVIASGAR